MAVYWSASSLGGVYCLQLRCRELGFHGDQRIAHFEQRHRYLSLLSIFEKLTSYSSIYYHYPNFLNIVN